MVFLWFSYGFPMVWLRPAVGSHDRHRLSSDTGPRTMYRVYRSGIASDAAMDSETLEKMPGVLRPVEKGRFEAG